MTCSVAGPPARAALFFSMTCPRGPPFPQPSAEHASDPRDLGVGWEQPWYCECVSGCPGWEVRGTLGSWAAEAMFEGQGMELLLTIVQTSAETPSCLQGIVTHRIADCHQH